MQGTPRMRRFSIITRNRDPLKTLPILKIEGPPGLRWAEWMYLVPDTSFAI